MSETTQNTPITFRMYSRIRFNRAIDRNKDNISVGGFGMTMDGKDIQFDFEEYEGSIVKEDPVVLEVIHKNPDYDCFEDLMQVTKKLLSKVTSIGEFAIEINDQEETDLKPVALEAVTFVLPYDDWREIEVSEAVVKAITLCPDAE